MGSLETWAKIRYFNFGSFFDVIQAFFLVPVSQTLSSPPATHISHCLALTHTSTNQPHDFRTVLGNLPVSGKGLERKEKAERCLPQRRDVQQSQGEGMWLSTHGESDLGAEPARTWNRAVL